MPKHGKRKRGPGRKRSAEPPRGTRDIPREKSIVAVDTITSPKGGRYAILETDQMDPYDDPKRKVKGRPARSECGAHASASSGLAP